MKRLFVDSDVFVRDLRYPRDKKQDPNQHFLNRIASGQLHAATSIFNVLEVCGILSFNLSGDELLDLYAGFAKHYRLKILFPADESGLFDYDIAGIFRHIQKKQSLGDAQCAYVIHRFSDQLDAYVGWNAKHFAGKIILPLKMPDEF